jgi:hypothetical protein
MASWRCCHDGRAAHHFAERAKSVEAANRTRIITFALSHRSSGHLQCPRLRQGHALALFADGERD